MNSLFQISAFFVFAVPLAVSLLGLCGLDSNSKKMLRIGFSGALVSFLSTLILGYGLFTQGPVDEIFAKVGLDNEVYFTIGVWVDRLSWTLLMLITSIGIIVQRYSARYLDGELRQGRFTSWLSFVLFAVSLFVMSRNLLALTLTWLLVSFGVHRLLLYYPERESAQRAAWRKFLISRVGDALLVLALFVTYKAFGTFEIKEIFSHASKPDSVLPIRFLGLSLNPLVLTGTLYVLGAMTKSAQFPFHIWLPDTMESPTPVSALMHAGIINAGGFLIVRLSPIVSHATLALDILLVLGALTAIFAGLVLLVQTDVKRSLAYSTVGQMGYMMMQCGVGAFSAGVLHLVMHGYYKAYSFLSAGGGVSNKHILSEKKTTTNLASYIFGAVISLALLMISVRLLDVDLSSKPGALLLAVFLWASATQAISKAFIPGGLTSTRIFTIGISFGAIILYWNLLAMFDWLLSPSINPDFAHETHPGLLLTLALVFILVFAITELARHQRNKKWAQHFYVLCLNHFYVEYGWRGIVHLLFGKTSLMPGFENRAIGQKTSRKGN